MKRMSKELAAMLEASAKARKTRRSLEVTRVQRICDHLGGRIIRKADGFVARQQYNPQIPAECIGTSGLRPVWHGRAS